MTDEIPPDEVLPCGCVIHCSIEDGVRTVTYIPCRQDCPNYVAMLAEAAAQNRPVTKKEAP